MLQHAIDSVAGQLSPESELLIFPNGPEGVAATAAANVPDGARVIASEASLDMVTNWNRCLRESSGELVHLLHDDDEVAPGYYEAILTLADRFPNAALYGTGYRPLVAGDAIEKRRDYARQYILAGETAARFLLTEGQHCCGSIVLSRRAFQQQGLFQDQYGYCPDEEAYLRYAAAGGVAFDASPLYGERAHGAQDRYAAWLKPDLVEQYMSARTDGARHFGSATVQIATKSSAKRLISVAVSLALDGDHAEASELLDALAERYPSCAAWPSYRLTKLGCRFRGVLRLAAGRRKILRAWREMQTISVTTTAR